MLVNLVKKISLNVPFKVGNYLSDAIQSTIKNHPTYKRFHNQRLIFDTVSVDKKKYYLYSNVKSFAIFAYENTKFYKEYYNDVSFDPYKLSCFEDLSNIPYIDKSMLQSVPLKNRTVPSLFSTKSNTGGSSGLPLNLSFSLNSVFNEFSNKHINWSHINFDKKTIRFQFVGRYKNTKIITYDFIQNCFIVNTNISWDKLVDELHNCLLIVKNKKLSVLIHGYPSIVFDFLDWCENNFQELNNYVDGYIFVSEIFTSVHQKKLLDFCDKDFITTYGHTERCVLAHAVNCLEYKVSQNYGFAESYINPEGDSELVGTNFNNNVCPLIRYKTGDLITPQFDDGLLSNFYIKNGRDGEFILDRHHKKLYLTAIIFGRHHKVFDISSSVQVKQLFPGTIVIYVVPKVKASICDNELFDFKDLHIDYTIEYVSTPFVTINGKHRLLLK